MVLLNMFLRERYKPEPWRVFMRGDVEEMAMEHMHAETQRRKMERRRRRLEEHEGRPMPMPSDPPELLDGMAMNGAQPKRAKGHTVGIIVDPT